MADAAMYNVDAEKEILSVIISKPNKLYDISRIIKADDFYRETNRLIYSDFLCVSVILRNFVINRMKNAV